MSLEGDVNIKASALLQTVRPQHFPTWRSNAAVVGVLGHGSAGVQLGAAQG